MFTGNPTTPVDPPAVVDDREPWEIAQDHVGPEHLGDQPVPYTGPGAVTHTHPILTCGSAGEDVRQLVTLLAELGYRDNACARGKSPTWVLDQSVMACVQRFSADHGARNCIDGFRGLTVSAESLVDQHVGPHIWQALLDAVAEKRAARRAATRVTAEV